MRSLLALIGKDVTLLVKDRIALAFTFAMPLVMIILFGFVFGGVGGKVGPITIIGIDHSNTELSRKIMSTLDTTSTLEVLHTYRSDDESRRERPYTDSVAAVAVRTGKVTAALIIPADAVTDTAVGMHLTLLYDARNDMETGMLEGILQQTIMTRIPGLFLSLMRHSTDNILGKATGKEFSQKLQDMLRKYFGNDAAAAAESTTAGLKSSTNPDSVMAGAAADSGTTKFFSNLIKFDKQQLVGEQLANPMVTRSIGGWALMFALFSLTAASRSLIEEREEGTLHRLLTAPIPRSTILLSKLIYAWLLGVVQLGVLFILGSLMFSVPIFRNFGNLVLMIGLASAAATALGMLIAGFARTSGQANGLGTILILTMSALGGSWFPVSMMPPFIQKLSHLTLTYWAVEGFSTVLYRNLGIANLWPNIAVLGSIAVVFTSVSLWKFGSREAW